MNMVAVLFFARAFFMYDGLGPVRQMTHFATLTLNQTFDPYGNSYTISGSVSMLATVSDRAQSAPESRSSEMEESLRLGPVNHRFL
jgi:hypothetical protein